MLSKSTFNRGKATKTVAALAALGIVGATAVLWSGRGVTAETQAVPRAVAAAPTAILAPVNIADVVERVSPAVVSIRVTAEQPQERNFAPPPGLEDFFEKFFGERFGAPSERPFRGPQHGEQGPDRPHMGPRVMQGIGSGFVIDKDGYIVTNNHVVGEADGIVVVMQDGKEFPAKLIGRDIKTDLAVIKIDAKMDLPHVSFGRSEDMRVGDWVITMGSPFGLGHTATTGIVSARHRDIGSGPYDDFLQIDAPINPGNSGGPAFNLAGDVIGVNTAIFSPNGGNIGIGFAIPSSLAKDVIAQLKTGKTISRGWLGVGIQAVTDDLADGVGLEKARGAIVTNVGDGSPAANGGIKQGDVILAVDGKDIDALRDLPKLVANLKPGHVAKVQVWRDRSEKTLNVTIGDMPMEDRVAQAESSGELGLTLAPAEDRHGVLVSGVKRDSTAARAGFRPGDVIVAVDGKDVGDPGDVVSAIHKHRDAKEKSILVLVSRGNFQRFVALPLGNA